MAKAAMLGMMAMALYAVNRGNEDYERLEDWDKWANFHIYLPKADGTTQHFTYPKMWEVGALASVAERTMEYLMDMAENGEAEEMEYAKDTLSIIANMFHLSVIPQAVKPIAEQIANQNFFTGRPIENQQLSNMEPWARATPLTNRSIAKLGESTRDLPRWAQIPPARAEAILRGYFNSWASMGLLLMDGLAHDSNPKMDIDRYPVIRAFYREGPQRNNKYSTEYYQLLREATETRRTLSFLDKHGKIDIADELADKPSNAFYRQITTANENVQAITRDIHQVYTSLESGYITPERAQQELEDLYAERLELMEEVVKDAPKAIRKNKD